ncbi:hypothetical protein NQ314_013403 [Rhamnusium bicolor]|uniref:DNA polymerase zeta catalytic subunit n=1 Tax=Rhamnusium bicolor TaxID=1586634 RepID=A0AAV8X5Y1_9CUCU|nr:hypothetical protein NQ314_013403 [Rhamnusium bicolor]
MNNFRKFKLETLDSNLEWKKSNLKNLKLGFCRDRDCIIAPVKKPPSVEMVKNWMKEKSRKVVTPVKNIEKIKILIPLSPGNDGNEDDMNVSLTISPCTPNISQSTASQNALDQTPKSSKTSTETANPVLEYECKKRLKHKLSSHSSTPSLRNSLLISQDSSHNQSCQITGVAMNNTYGFNKSTENLQKARAVIEHQHLTLLVMEMHIRTRGDFKPNPEYDSVRAIFYSVLNDVPENHPKATKAKGVIAINSLPLSPGTTKVPILDGAGIDCDIIYVDSEDNLFNEFLKVINYWDPDIIAGYEIEMLSWGYLIERAYVLGMNIKPLLARTKGSSHTRKDEDRENELKIVGRIVLDVWRLMRHEIALQSYTFESIIYHILQKRVPQYSFRDLSFWWDHRSTIYRHRTVHYYLFRVVMILELFDKLDLIGRTSELARLFGIQFYEVLSRGSQFRVESMMLRLAKPLNFIPVSPSVQQRAKMKAPEYIALVLEPESKLYNDPVIVLDFQSLYPSIIIAYNYCFTTCIGKVECLGKNDPFEFGASQLKISTRKLEKLLKKDLLNFSPCGVGFVKKQVRDGILPRMLREILDTRLMVKNSMKENKDEQLLQKVLHNRQLGLKLIANVTYGYTAANFSGRMPSVEVGDSVVSKGKLF